MEDPYQQMDELLVSWKLPHLCHIFREQEITVDALEALTETDIVELIPKVGPRAVFRKRLTEWLNTTEIIYELPATVEAKTENNQKPYYKIETFEQDINDTEEATNLSTDELPISNEVEIEVEDGMWSANITKDNSNIAEELTTNDSTNEHEEFMNIDFLDEVIEEIEPVETKLVNEKAQTQNFYQEYKSEIAEFIKLESNNAAQLVKQKEKAEFHCYLNVEQLLQSTEMGRTIMENHRLDTEMSKQARIYIADLIITEVFAKNLVLDREKFQNIAQQVIELFPNEDIKTWFNGKNGSRNSTGTLFNKYYTVYRKMRKTGFYEHYMDGVIKSFDMDEESDKKRCINPEQIDDEPEKLALKRAIPKYERLRRSCDFEEINVKALLESSFEGRGIIEIYEKQQGFDSSARNRLCKLIVMHASSRNIKMRPRNFYDISCQIVNLFPSETIDMYYLPRGRNTPRGCLYHKYLYFKRRLRQIGAGNKANKNVE